jgi:hypothetical protein
LRLVGEGDPPAREEMELLEKEDEMELLEPKEEEIEERLLLPPAVELRFVFRYVFS